MRRRSRLVHTVYCAILIVAGSAVVARQAMAILADSDAASARHAMLQQILETLQSGQTLAWRVGDGTVRSVTPVRTWRTTSGHYCRQFEEAIRADNQLPELFTGVACRNGDGRWTEIDKPSKEKKFA